MAKCRAAWFGWWDNFDVDINRRSSTFQKLNRTATIALSMIAIHNHSLQPPWQSLVLHFPRWTMLLTYHPGLRIHLYPGISLLVTSTPRISWLHMVKFKVIALMLWVLTGMLDHRWRRGRWGCCCGCPGLSAWFDSSKSRCRYVCVLLVFYCPWGNYFRRSPPVVPPCHATIIRTNKRTTRYNEWTDQHSDPTPWHRYPTPWQCDGTAE